MSGFELVASVIAVFFGIGVVVGVLFVIALPAIRGRGRRGRLGRRRDGYRRDIGEYDDDLSGWVDPPDSGENDRPFRWPGD